MGAFPIKTAFAAIKLKQQNICSRLYLTKKTCYNQGLSRALLHWCLCCIIASARPGERNCEEGARVVVGGRVALVVGGGVTLVVGARVVVGRRVALVVGGVALVVGACCTAACSTVPLKICF